MTIYFGTDEQEKEKSFEFLCEKNDDKLTREQLEWFQSVRLDSGTYIFNYYKDGIIKFTLAYASPKLNLSLNFPFAWVFPEDAAGSDSDYNLGLSCNSVIGELFNLASDLGPFEFIEVVEQAMEKIWFAHLSMNGEYLFLIVNPKHTNFYTKILNAKKINNVRNHPVLQLPCQLLYFGIHNETD